MISAYAGSSRARRSGSGGSPSDAADRGGRGFGIPLRQPQQREPGLRLPPNRLAFAVRRLGRGEVAPQPVELRLLVERLARRRRGSSPARTARARQARLRQRVGPGAVELHDRRRGGRGSGR